MGNRLRAICDLDGVVGADEVLVLVPKGEPDFMDFDSEVCDLGTKEFFRPLLPSDSLTPKGLPPMGTTHMLVKEVVPGVRLRSPFRLITRKTPKQRAKERKKRH